MTTCAEVERVVLVRERLHVAHSQVGIQKPLAGTREELRGGVESEWLRSAFGDKAEEGADAAADVEHVLRGPDTDTAQRLLVGGDLLILAERPIRGSGTPQRSPTLGAAGRGRRRPGT
jgi:hypothetical protein